MKLRHTPHPMRESSSHARRPDAKEALRARRRERYRETRKAVLKRQHEHRASIEGRAADLLRDAHRRASKSGVLFSLTRDWIVERLRRGTCEATGLPFNLARPEGVRVNPFAPSLERRRRVEGYTETNTIVVIAFYNILKSDFSEEQVTFLLTTIAERLHRGVVGGVCLHEHLASTSRVPRRRRRVTKRKPKSPRPTRAPRRPN